MAPNTLDSLSKTTESLKEEESSVRSRANDSIKDVISKTCKEGGSVQKGHSPSHDNEIIDDINHNEENTVFKPRIRWPDLIAQVFVHVGSLYGLYYLITLQAKLYTYIWCKQKFSMSKSVENQFSFIFSCRAGLHIRNWNHSR